MASVVLLVLCTVLVTKFQFQVAASQLLSSDLPALNVGGHDTPAGWGPDFRQGIRFAYQVVAK
jgi:hypothetical protein